MAKSVKSQVADAVAGVADVVSVSKGQIFVRRSFYYRHGYDADKFAAAVQRAVDAAKVPVTVQEHGEKYKAFRGGDTVAQGSHWWCRVA